MYSTCIYCTKDLGANEAVELLPIGRRIAFDQAEGRLWVVCRACEKWNLVPFDTRLETIDECARVYSGTRIRFSTDNIGIARLPDGTELVRIGSAQRPEFAAWRYGDQFGRRRWKHAAQVGIVSAGLIVVYVGGLAILKTVGVSVPMLSQAPSWIAQFYNRRRTAVRLSAADRAATRILTGKHLSDARIVRAVGLNQAPGEWGIEVQTFDSERRGFATGKKTTTSVFTGAAGVDALGKIMPHINRSGGSSRRVREAVELVETSPPLVNPEFRKLKALHPTVRLALEMSAHEDTERIALAGELSLLERQWKEADEVAKIADSLAVSDDVQRRIDGRNS